MAIEEMLVLIADNIGTIAKTIAYFLGGVVGIYVISLLLRLYFTRKSIKIQKAYQKKVDDIYVKIEEIDKKLDKLIKKK